MNVLSEESVKEFIQKDRVLVKVWAQNCPYCTRLDEQLARVDLTGFECGMLEVSHPMDKNPRPSEFKRTWMKMDKSDVVKDSVPAIFVFEKGELKHRQFGMLYSDSLQHWLRTGEVIPSKIQQEERAAQEKQKKLYELFAQRGELTFNLTRINAKLTATDEAIEELLK
jgi:thioredoxin-like negative regulator of GroEL